MRNKPFKAKCKNGACRGRTSPRQKTPHHHENESEYSKISGNKPIRARLQRKPTTAMPHRETASQPAVAEQPPAAERERARAATSRSVADILSKIRAQVQQRYSRHRISIPFKFSSCSAVFKAQDQHTIQVFKLLICVYALTVSSKYKVQHCKTTGLQLRAGECALEPLQSPARRAGVEEHVHAPWPAPASDFACLLLAHRYV